MSFLYLTEVAAGLGIGQHVWRSQVPSHLVFLPLAPLRRRQVLQRL